MFVILSERGPRRSLQPGGGESKDLLLHFFALYQGTVSTVPTHALPAFKNQSTRRKPR